MWYEFQGFRLEADRRRLLSLSLGEPVPLPPRVLDTLLYLVERPGELVTKDAVMKAVWAHVVVEENNLDRNISTLRRVLGETPGENRFIATVPGRGYRFVANVTRVPAVPADKPAPTAAGSSSDAKTAQWVSGETGSDPRAPFAAARVAAVALMLLLAGGAIWLLARQPSGGRQQNSALADSAVAGSLEAAPRASVAVVPFANVTGDSSKEYLSDGIAEELIHSLARVKGLRVPARTSSFAYKGRSVDAREIARDLGVSHILEGSVRGAGDDVLVTAQLIDAQNGFHVWSQTYQRKADDLFRLQAELASAIAFKLAPSLHAGGTAATLNDPPPTSNVGAYHLFMQANALVGASESNLSKAMTLYDRALQLDPRFARAHSARASTQLTSLIFGLTAPDPLLSGAERDAQRAQELDPSLASAQSALGLAHVLRGRWLEAERAFRIALSQDETDPMILGDHTFLLASVGRIREASREAETAVQLAPLALPSLMRRAMYNSLLGNDQAAVSDTEVGMSLGAPRDTGAVPIILSVSAQRAGRYDEAAERFLDFLPPRARAAGAQTAVRLAFEALENPAKKPVALAALRDLESGLTLGDLDPRRGSSLISLYTELGDLDAAYSLANRILDELASSGSIGFWRAVWAREMHPFRQDSRFQALVGRLKLMEYWKVYGPPDGCTLSGDKVVCT